MNVITKIQSPYFETEHLFFDVVHLLCRYMHFMLSSTTLSLKVELDIHWNL